MESITGKNMESRRLWIALSALTGATLLAGAIATIVYSDKEGPVITIPDAEILYREGEPTEPLLTGVAAWDSRDGDVTESLIIESIIPIGNYTTASVIYAAKDHSNNIETAVRVVSYEAPPQSDRETTKQSLSDQVRREAAVAAANQVVKVYQNTEVSDHAVPKEPETALSETKTSGEAENVSANEIASEEETSDGNEVTGQEDGLGVAAGAAAVIGSQSAPVKLGIPTIALTTNYITMNQGDSFHTYAYIQDAKDDKDPAMTMVQTEGSVDTNKAGSYEVKYYVIDSDGNRSNVEVLQVVVLESTGR